MKKTITVAPHAGFCFGVQRAVDTVEKLAMGEGDGRIYTYGPIIHNEQVVRALEKKGVSVLHSEEELQKLENDKNDEKREKSIIVIRSHGVSEEIEKQLKATGAKIQDATCPFVKKIHKIAKKAAEEQAILVIAGDPRHPEVQGIIGWTSGEYYVVESPSEMQELVPRLPSGRKIILVAQTTFDKAKFEDIVEIFKKMDYYSVVDSICNATQVRQSEAAKIAGEVEAMIVIGGRHSSNTQKLAEICREKCKNTYFIETLDDLNIQHLQSFSHVGITAGASTPKRIIEEVKRRMSEESFEEMLEASLKTVRNGEVVTGTVIDVKPDQIILNIGTKSDGILTKNEYSNDPSVDLTEKAKIGDEMEVKVLKVSDGDGQMILSYKRLAAEKGNKKLQDAFENHEVLTAKVTRVLNGGLSVTVDGARVFIPASLVSDTYERDLNKYLNQDIEFVVTEFNPRRRRIIGDRKQLIVEEKKKAAAELFARINPGDVVEGTVKNITDFGAFIDLGGADGLLHISEMSWGRVDNPRSIVTVGERLTVLIKDIKGDRIALSLKFEDQNPWRTASERYYSGAIVTGRVARMTDFGAFVELEPGIDALLHVSQISRQHVDKPSSVLSVGQEITAKVVDFREAERKISLSMKALEEDEALAGVQEEPEAAEEETEEPSEE